MSLMSASYPGYYNNTTAPTVQWRGGDSGRAVARPRDGPHILSNTRLPNPQTPFDNSAAVNNFVSSSPSQDAHVLRYVNTAVANLTLGTSKLELDDSLIDEKYEDPYNSSSAMAIPLASSPQEQSWKKASGDHHNNSHSSSPGATSPVDGSPNKRSSLDIEKEINAQNLYKTELCRSFVETGTCRYGSKCQFAHGQSELRPVLRHPKYKTDFCKTFHTIGTCPYGTRCRFIHKRSEVEVGQNSIYLPPPVNTPEWFLWKDTQEGKLYYAQLQQQAAENERQLKPRSNSVKERRKTANDLQQLQKLEKNKQRVIGRQRSNTDSPPPPMRKKHQNLSTKKVQQVSIPVGKPDHEKNHRRRKSTGGPAWAEGVPSGEDEGPTSPHELGNAGLDGGMGGMPHSPNGSLPPASIPMAMPTMPIGYGHLNGHSVVGGPRSGGMMHPLSRGMTADPRSLSHARQLEAAAAAAAAESERRSGEKSKYLSGSPEEVYRSPPAPASPPVVAEEPEAPLKDKQRGRSNSSASRLPIFQELCTASTEEDIAVGANASTVVNRVLSSSS